MRKNTLVGVLLLLTVGAFLIAPIWGAPQPIEETHDQTKVAVIFGSINVLDLATIRSNAVVALGKKGFTPPAWSTCSINIQVGGVNPGCFLTFYDLTNRMIYPVNFNSNGVVVEAYGERMRKSHGKLGNPPPQIPPGSAMKLFDPKPSDGKEFE